MGKEAALSVFVDLLSKLIGQAKGYNRRLSYNVWQQCFVRKASTHEKFSKNGSVEKH